MSKFKDGDHVIVYGACVLGVFNGYREGFVGARAPIVGCYDVHCPGLLQPILAHENQLRFYSETEKAEVDLQMANVETERWKLIGEGAVALVVALRGALERVTVDESNGYSIDELLAKLRDLGLKYGGFQNGYAVNAVLNQRTEARKALSLPVPELAQAVQGVIDVARRISPCNPMPDLKGNEFIGWKACTCYRCTALSRLDAAMGAK